MRFEICARQAIGSRDKQQDSWAVTDGNGASLDASVQQGMAIVNDRALIVVADGVGGARSPHSDVASKLASATFIRTFQQTQGTVRDRFDAALSSAHQAVSEESNTDPSLVGIATTLIGVWLNGNQMNFASAGDSLILRLRDEEIHAVNLKHVAYEKYDRDAVNAGTQQAWVDSYKSHGNRMSITLAVGHALRDDFTGHMPQFSQRTILPGDIMIVSSDGLETLKPEQIQNIARQLAGRSIEAFADALMTAVLGTAAALKWKQDNTTFVVIRAVDDVTRIEAGPREAVAAVGSPAIRAEALPQSAPPPPSPPAQRRGGLLDWLSPGMALGLATLLLAIGLGAVAYVALFPPSASRTSAGGKTTAPTAQTPADQSYGQAQQLQRSANPPGTSYQPPNPYAAPRSYEQQNSSPLPGSRSGQGHDYNSAPSNYAPAPRSNMIDTGPANGPATQDRQAGEPPNGSAQLSADPRWPWPNRPTTLTPPCNTKPITYARGNNGCG